ncbi:hypothetical protein [Ornithinimicrobium kibberense]|uniref:hypothetical protein n=1 Tax=Ornithinimicrobium kibberense TaxID=282060 RepID=UPI0036241D21
MSDAHARRRPRSGGGEPPAQPAPGAAGSPLATALRLPPGHRVGQPEERRPGRAAGSHLRQEPAVEEGGVQGVLVLGDEVHRAGAREPRQGLLDAASRVGTDRAGPHPGDDDRAGRDGVPGQLVQAPDQALEPDGVGRPDDHDPVRRFEGRQRRPVAPGREGVEGELLVLLQGRGDVHDGPAGQPAALREDVGEGHVAQLGPPVGPGQAGEQAQAGSDLGGQPCQGLAVELPLVGGPGGGGHARHLVEDREQLGLARPVGVGVDQDRRLQGVGQLGGQVGGDGGSTAAADRSPDHHDLPLVRPGPLLRPGPLVRPRPVGPVAVVQVAVRNRPVHGPAVLVAGRAGRVVGPRDDGPRVVGALLPGPPPTERRRGPRRGRVTLRGRLAHAGVGAAGRRYGGRPALPGRPGGSGAGRV